MPLLSFTEIYISATFATLDSDIGLAEVLSLECMPMKLGELHGSGRTATDSTDKMRPSRRESWLVRVE